MIADRNPAVEARRRKFRHRWVFPIASILLGLSIFVLLELACAVFGFGELGAQDDPFVGFSSVRPLFEPTADGQLFHTSPVRRKFFKEDSFAVRKQPREFRIFVFGGSTVQGNPFSIETSFPAYLQMALQIADPSRVWKVVNCGGVSYASYRLVPVMQECLAYEPDLFIFCGGHNEFLEDVSYSSVRNTSPLIRDGVAKIIQLRSFTILRRAFQWISDSPESSTISEPQNVQNFSKPMLPEEVDTLLDHDGGLATYHRDIEHASAVAEHFRGNLIRMTELCRSSSVPLLLMLPPSNLSDCPPFKTEFSEALSDDERRSIATHLMKAREVAAADIMAAIEFTQAATQLDPHYALAWYELGHFLLASRQFPAAEQAFRRARDEDICPLRITSALEDAMLQVVAQTNSHFIDVHNLLQQRCSNGIVGDNVLVDHVHPSFRGHEDIAIAIAEWMIQLRFAVTQETRWQDKTHEACQSRLQSLDNLYFLRGRRALDNLRLWAAGRSGGPPLNSRPP